MNKSARWFVIVSLMSFAASAYSAVTISPTSRDFAAAGEGATISTSGSGNWTATTDADWITLVKKSGAAGSACAYLVARNTNADARTGHITIEGNVFTVTQQGCSITLTPASISLDKNGGSGTITVIVDAGVTWTSSPSDSWITVSPTSGNGPTEISYSIAAFNDVGSRTGSIRIGSDTVSVTQTGIDVTLNPASTNVANGVCIVPVQVVASASTKWTVTPNDTWISVLDGGNGFGGSQITLAVAENPSYAKRTGTVAVGSAVLTIIQDATDDVSFKILPETATASPSGAFGNVAVYATPDATWSAESMNDWLRITAGDDGAGNGNVKYVTLSNPELTNRVGKIKFTPPVVTPDFDITAGLLFWIKEQTNIEGNDLRQATYSLTNQFDGSFSNPLTGKDIPALTEYGYAMSFSVRIGELDRINRIMQLGSNRCLYLNENNILCLGIAKSGGGWEAVETSFTWPGTDSYYTILINQTLKDGMNIYVGQMNTELSSVLVNSDSVGANLGNAAVPMSQFVFGYCDGPSSGYLTSGQIANIRFWTRMLTEKECVNADKQQDQSADDKPGLVSDEYTYFSFAGNLFAHNATNESAMVPGVEFGGMISNACFESGRSRVLHNALMLSSNSVLQLDDLNQFFAQDYELHSGNLDLQNYDFYYSEPNGSGWSEWRISRAADPVDDNDATIATWFKIDKLPTEGNLCGLLSRQLSPRPQRIDGNGGMIPGSPLYLRFEQDLGGITNNFRLSVCITHGGNICLIQEQCDGTRLYYGDGHYDYYFKRSYAVTNVFSNICINMGEWMQLAIVGSAEKTISIYLNGQEIGNVPTRMWFGFLPPIDLSYNMGYGTENCYAWHSYIFQMGGYEGCLDDLTIYPRALLPKEVKEMYEARLPAEDVYHTVTQGIQEPSLSEESINIGKSGGATNVTLTVAKKINWTAESSDSWIHVTTPASGTGPTTVGLTIDANTEVVQRTGTVIIGTKTLTIVQEALSCEVVVDTELFDVESGMGTIEISPEANGNWTASTDVDWIYLAAESGTGSEDVYFFVDYFDDPNASRSGTITVGEHVITITQRGYELSIDPAIADVGGNSGAGAIGVAADPDAIWTAISECDWITIVTGSTGIGNGTVRYSFTDNTTGQTRTGHIRISGQDYVLTQTCALALTTSVVGNGSVAGGGNYAQGKTVTLTATPGDGYVFSHWSGDMVGVTNVSDVVMDSVKNVTATFIPESAAEQLATAKAAQGGFYTRDQIHNLEVGNLVLDVDSTTGKARIGVQLQETSDLSNPNWKAVNVSSGDLDIGSDGTVGIKASATGNAKFFRVVTPSN